ncbi:MAG: hypothetical protein J6V72_00045 [Kiritimatiellae bacterium]|nr:hypothetical protein [Kiritimatiellia bacterium]
MPDPAGFRLFAENEPVTVITHPDVATPGSNVTITAAATTGDKFFCAWDGAATYADAGANPTTVLADNHRAVRCAWGKAISTPEQLAAIADDPAGTYVLTADLDLAGIDWTPLCQDSYTPFSGTLYGNGHTISNLTVNTEGSSYAGLFGCLGSGASISGIRLVNPVVSGYGYIGALAGYVKDGASISSCAAIGATITSTGDRAGALLGQVEGGSTVSACFVVGTVDSTSSYAGGFAGYVGGSSSVSDCYAVADVKGNRYVGGFVGYVDGSATSVVRCYFGGGDIAGSQDVGGFAGYQYSSPSFADCFRIADGLADIGSADHANITALDAVGMRDTDNFAAFHATGLWTQTDGLTQPYFAWGLVNGKFILSGASTGSGSGTITGLGTYAPGATVPIEAVPAGSLFLGWIGSADYADPTAAATTVLLDNYRTVTVEFGGLITSFDQLANVTNDLTGSFGLGADIDLSGAAWTAIGNNSTPFKGSLYGRGYKITGLNLSSGSDYAGLFGVVQDATLDGIVIEDASVNGYRYTGALAGEVRGTTTIRNCSASGIVTNSNVYAGLLVGRVYGQGGTTFENCAATGMVVSAGENTGGLVGGVYYYPATFADCNADVFVTGTGGGSKGGFIGSVRDSNASATFARCVATGDLVATNNSSNVGGFIGYANKVVSFEDCSAVGDVSGKGSTGGFAGKTESAVANYIRCSASGTVVNWSSSCAGGFIGYAGGSGIVFTDCSAAGDVRSTSSQTGGFVGYVGASNVLERCVAVGAVSGTSQTGGFVGQANGDRSQYVSCEAHGSVTGTGNQAGGFVGQIGSTGLRFAQCSALGGVSDPAYSYVGGFVGQVNNSNDLWRCMCAGAAVGKQYVGGFVGYQYGGNTTIRECFALGDAAALNTGDAYAGGFVGDLSATTYLSDSYCLGTVKGQQKVGGFAGRNYNSATTITRCYAAGVLDCTGTYAGAFVGYLQNAATFADCAVLCDGIHAVGSSTVGTSTENAAIAEYDAAGMKSTANFATWLLVDGLDGSLWSQSDGDTQPYLAWSAPNGKLSVYASVGGSARGEIEGAGEYAPGTTATVTAIPDGGFFVAWTGSTPYADPSAPTTTIALDNHRVAAVTFGKYISTADELDAVRNDLAGIYGLANDIDLSGRDWTPLGNNSTKFTGKFYGLGHAITGLFCTNNYTLSSSSYRGLFGYTSGATLDGITVTGNVAGYQYVGGLVGAAAATTINCCTANVDAVASYRYGDELGGLVGRVEAGTAIFGCSASGTATGAGNYAGGLVGNCAGAFEIRDSVSAVEVSASGQYVGGFVGYTSGSGASVISGCRADGYAGGNGYVGGFIGYVSSQLTISNCVARGDVRSSSNNYGGFVGYLSNASATIADCWCQGAVWGTGSNIGSFVGNKSNGTIQNCSIYAYGAGPRPFCGSGSASGGSLTAKQINDLSAEWPTVKQHVHGATKIQTAEDLFAVTNNLAGIYALDRDIDLGGATIEPIGNYSTAFTGEFYGRNHRIFNFTVSNKDRYAGLFGNIAGGRVSGVIAEGTVVSASTFSSYNDVGVGGFAGKIQNNSLVDGCSFQGAVTNTTTYNLGGFVGMTANSPVILRCCVLNATVANTSGQSDTGGFIGYHTGGYIMDCYAIADVSGKNYLGGFLGCRGGGKITTSYCSGTVQTSGTTSIGAFAGSANSGDVTQSYYETNKTTRLAVNGAAYVGVTGLSSAAMKSSASFDFDFDRTWLIDEGMSTPYLQTFIVVKRGFDVWTEQSGYPEGTEPGDVIDGIPAGVRYVFNIPADATNINALPGEQFFHVTMDAYGNPCVKFRAKRDPYEGVEPNITIYAVLDLSDCISDDPAEWRNLVPMRYDVLSDTWHPADGSHPPKMFFKWRVNVNRVDE